MNAFEPGLAGRVVKLADWSQRPILSLQSRLRNVRVLDASAHGDPASSPAGHRAPAHNK